MADDKLTRVLSGIEALNREDPNTETVDGAEQPRECVYAQRLTAWVLRLNPNASEALRIAAAGQHVQRWKVPRDSYPMTRAGYLRWREGLKGLHADTVAGVMRQAGYDETTIAVVRRLISKRDLKSDPDTQTLEDGLCLVFLETQLTDLRIKTPDDKMIEVIRKTWTKMSAQGHTLALELPQSEENRALLKRALAS